MEKNQNFHKLSEKFSDPHIRDDDSIFYLLSWKDLAAFNKVIETLISHHSLANSDRCVPFEIAHKDGVTPISQAKVRV